jgi:hypothetical protein
MSGRYHRASSGSIMSMEWTEAELKALRRSVQCGTPYGDTVWQQETAKELHLESSLRLPGRPRKQTA